MRFQPLNPSALVHALAEAVPVRNRPTRVALDGPGCAELTALALRIVDQLRASGRPAAVVPASGFYRDASLRFEYGKTDLESFYTGWLDRDALQREVLLALDCEESPSYLPSLRDPVTNRSTRVPPLAVPTNAAVIVVGEFLLGSELSFDVSIHAAVSRAARRRLTGPELQWTLAAFDRYDIDVDPSAVADVVLRYDDPAHPAIRRKRD